VKKIKLAENLNRLMKQNSVSTRALSKETGVPQSTISALCAGRSSQKPEHLLAIAKRFSVSMEFLIFGEDQQPPNLENVLTEQIFSGWIKIHVERAIPDKKK
jgi:transcriptional regulator with XRE-family HTH domain